MTIHEIRIWNEDDLWELVDKLGSPKVVIFEEHTSTVDIYDYTYEPNKSRGGPSYPPEWRLDVLDAIHITLVWDHLVAGYYHRILSKNSLRLDVPVQEDQRRCNRATRDRNARGGWISKDIWLHGRQSCYEEEALQDWLTAFKGKFATRRSWLGKQVVPIVNGRLKVPEPPFYDGEY